METKGKVIRLKHRVASSVIELQGLNQCVTNRNETRERQAVAAINQNVPRLLGC